MSTQKSGKNSGGKLPCGNLSKIVNGFTKRTGRIYRRTQTMNKRIRKKKAKQQLIRAISGLVEAAEEMQREQERRTRQAGISYIKYIEAVRERQYGIMPVYTPLFEKEGA